MKNLKELKKGVLVPREIAEAVEKKHSHMQPAFGKFKWAPYLTKLVEADARNLVNWEGFQK
jgi:sugar phosphate isomerase/epimerase